MKDETGWVIERGHEPLYWTGTYSKNDSGSIQSHFARNHLQAVRFARREDAEKVIQGLWGTLGGDIKTVEHLWVGDEA